MPPSSIFTHLHDYQMFEKTFNLFPPSQSGTPILVYENQEHLFFLLVQIFFQLGLCIAGAGWRQREVSCVSTDVSWYSATLPAAALLYSCRPVLIFWFRVNFSLSQTIVSQISRILDSDWYRYWCWYSATLAAALLCCCCRPVLIFGQFRFFFVTNFS